MQQIIIEAKIDVVEIGKKDSSRNRQLDEIKNINKQTTRGATLGENNRLINQDGEEVLSVVYDATRQFNTNMSSGTSTGASRGSMGAQRGRRYQHTEYGSPSLPARSHRTSEHIQNLQTNK